MTELIETPVSEKDKTSTVHTRKEESPEFSSDSNINPEVKFEISVNKIKKTRKPRGVLAE